MAIVAAPLAVLAGSTASAASVTNALWYVSSNNGNATNVTYTWKIVAPSGSVSGSYVHSLTLTVPVTSEGSTKSTASGTATGTVSVSGATYTNASGTATALPISSAGLANGTVTVQISGDVTMPANTQIVIPVSGLTNLAQGTQYNSTVAHFQSTVGTHTSTDGSGSAIDSGTTRNYVDIAPASNGMSGAAFVNDSSQVSTAAKYTWDFTPTANSYSKFTFTVPDGTTSSGTLAATFAMDKSYETPTPDKYSVAFNASADVVTVTFTAATYLSSKVHVEVTGLVNTSVPGTYSSTLTTYGASAGIVIVWGSQTAGAVPIVAPAATIPQVTFGLADAVGTGSVINKTAVTYSVTFNMPSTGGPFTATEVDMTVPPGTTVTPSASVGVLCSSIIPTALAGCTGTDTLTSPATASLNTSGNVLKFSFPAQTLANSALVSVSFTQLKNTSSAQSFRSTVLVYNGSSAVAAGQSNYVYFVNGNLTALTWSPSTGAIGADNVNYSYGFTITDGNANGGYQPNRITMTLPPGTTTTAANGGCGSASTGLTVVAFTAYLSKDNTGSYDQTYLQDVANTTACITTDGVLQIDFPKSSSQNGFNTAWHAGTVVNLTVTGFHNTSSSGAYQSQIVTWDTEHSNSTNSVVIDAGNAISAGFTPAVLNSVSWTSSSTYPSDTADYTYSFSPSAAVVGGSVTMSVPTNTVAGSGGLVLGDVTIGGHTYYAGASDAAGSTIALANGVLTYSFPTAARDPGDSLVHLAANTPVVIEIRNVQNTNLVATAAAEVRILDGNELEASGTSSTLTISKTSLQATWSFSPDPVVDNPSDYTFTVTVPTLPYTTTSFTFTLPTGSQVPLGSNGQPTVEPTGTCTDGTTPAYGSYGGHCLTLQGMSTQVVGKVLTVSFTHIYDQTAGSNDDTPSDGTVFTFIFPNIVNAPTAAPQSAMVTAYNQSVPMASGWTQQTNFGQATLASASWVPSSTITGTPVGTVCPSYNGGSGNGTQVEYDYSFALSAAATLTKVQMDLPSGTPADVPSLLGVTGFAFSNGTLARDGSNSSGLLLTYLFDEVSVPAHTTVTIKVQGIANTCTDGDYQPTIRVFNSSGVPVELRSSTPVHLGSVNTQITDVQWDPVSPTAPTNPTQTVQGKVRGQEYSWTFATPANFPQNATGTVTRLVLTVPPGTAGTPTVSSIGYTGSSSGSMTVTSAAISDSSLILNLATPATVPKSVSFTVVVDGLTNTGTGGVFNSSVSFQNGIANVVSGTGTTMWTFSPYVAGTSAVTWTPSSLVTGDAPVHFDYSATSPSQLLPGVKTMVVTLPTDTSGTPGSPINVTIGGSTVSATVGAITSNAVVLTLASTQDIAAGTHLTFSLTGLTNTAASGTYASNVVLYDDASFQLWEFDSVTKDFGEPGEDVPGTGDLDWALSSAVAGASGLSYTFTFTAATDADLTSLQLTLPSGTDASALTVSSISPAAITSVSAVAISNVLTLSWSPAVTVGPDSANPHTIVLTLNHVTNAEVGSYAPTMTTYDADGVVDTATADLTDLLAATFGISVACGTNANCATHGSDTEISIVALPGQSVVTVGGVDVTVTTNAPGGYLLRLLATALKKDDGVELHAGYDTNAYGFTGSMSSSRPGAQVCSPFNGASAAAYPLSSFLLAAAGTGTDGDGDTVTLDTQVQVSPLQPAGVYHGALSFLATPNFDQSAGSAC